MKCDLCDYEAEGETFASWVEALKPHYMQAHLAVMLDPSKTKDDLDAWLAENKIRFNQMQ